VSTPSGDVSTISSARNGSSSGVTKALATRGFDGATATALESPTPIIGNIWYLLNPSE